MEFNFSDPSKNEAIIAHNISNLIVEVFVSYEITHYKETEQKDILLEQSMNEKTISMVENVLDDLYQILADDDGSLFCRVMRPATDILGHHELCALRKVWEFFLKRAPFFMRGGLRVENEEEYVMSVREELDKAGFKGVLSMFERELVDHFRGEKCEYEDVIFDEGEWVWEIEEGVEA